MKIEMINPESLTLTNMMDNMSELYFLHMSDELGKPILTPMSVGSIGLLKDDSLLVRIIPAIEQETVEEPKPKSVRTRKHREMLTYKVFAKDPTESIIAEVRPDGDIRVSFKDKESAQAYFEYFREQFYTSTTGASVITVSNIYKDLNLVNWLPENCDDWGWYTLDHGTCRYIMEVTKTRNTKLWGFTLKRPTRLYESKKREA